MSGEVKQRLDVPDYITRFESGTWTVATIDTPPTGTP